LERVNSTLARNRQYRNHISAGANRIWNHVPTPLAPGVHGYPITQSTPIHARYGTRSERARRVTVCRGA